MSEKPCPYCKGAGVQQLPVRAATSADKNLTIEERHGARVVIEPVYFWKCRGTGKITEQNQSLARPTAGKLEKPSDDCPARVR